MIHFHYYHCCYYGLTMGLYMRDWVFIAFNVDISQVYIDDYLVCLSLYSEQFKYLLNTMSINNSILMDQELQNQNAQQGSLLV